MSAHATLGEQELRSFVTFVASGAPSADEWVRLQRLVPENEAREPHPVIRETPPDAFRVLIPLTGGLDSSTLWMMAGEAGVRSRAVYVDLGQEYAKAEIEAAIDVTGVEPYRIDARWFMDQNPARWKHVIAGRNVAAIWLVAWHAAQRGWWGEIWFGNLAGESPIVGGDKSYAFLVGAQQRLTEQGYDFRLSSPLQGLDKSDCVRWWADHFGEAGVKRLAMAKSCFHPTDPACGSCQSCFRKYVAFAAAGYPLPLDHFANLDFGPHVAKYEPLMRHALDHNDWARYSPARARDTLAAIRALREMGVPV